MKKSILGVLKWIILLMLAIVMLVREYPKVCVNLQTDVR